MPGEDPPYVAYVASSPLAPATAMHPVVTAPMPASFAVAGAGAAAPAPPAPAPAPAALAAPTGAATPAGASAGSAGGAASGSTDGKKGGKFAVSFGLKIGTKAAAKAAGAKAASAKSSLATKKHVQQIGLWGARQKELGAGEADEDEDEEVAPAPYMAPAKVGRASGTQVSGVAEGAAPALNMTAGSRKGGYGVQAIAPANAGGRGGSSLVRDVVPKGRGPGFKLGVNGAGSDAEVVAQLTAAAAAAAAPAPAGPPNLAVIGCSYASLSRLRLDGDLLVKHQNGKWVCLVSRRAFATADQVEKHVHQSPLYKAELTKAIAAGRVELIS